MVAIKYINFFTNPPKEYRFVDTFCLYKCQNDKKVSNYDLFGHKTPFVICKTCGLVRASRFMDPKSLSDFYQNHYTKIFSDNKNDWFRNEFIELGTLEYHIKGQTNFWLDIMGGGEKYLKSEKAVFYKHKNAESIMTQKGANKWMKHMINSLYEVNLCQLNDKRIIPCISDFLYYFMEKYSKEFDFNFYEFNTISKL